MADTQTAQPSEQAVKQAQDVWAGFVNLSKISIYAVSAILVLLWLIFIA